MLNYYTDYNMDNTTLQVIDGTITVDTINVNTMTSHTVKGDITVFGVLSAGQIRTNELLVHRRFDQQYLEFANPEGGEAIGAGLLWTGGDYNRQLVFQSNPNRLFTTENIDINNGNSYLIDGQAVISSNSLGKGIVNSNLQTVGTLKNLVVSGPVNIGDTIFFNPVSQRVSIGTADANGVLTIFDYYNGVELILSGDSDGEGVIGTFNTKSLKIVTDNQTRATFHQDGDITLGVEGTDGTIVRTYGTLSVGVKNPTAQLEVAGDVRFDGKLFTKGNSAPTSGNYMQGDIVWNTNPKANSYVGWVCILGGSPGQWLPFGAIAAN